MMLLWFAFVGASVGAGVAPLTTSNFSSVTGNPESLWLVKFYAPWCGHCKRLAPILDEVADEVEGVTIGKVDATIETALRDRYSVKGYPTLLVMQHGKTWEHRGQRNKPGILKLIERMKQPAVATLATEAELRAASRPVLFLLGRADSTDEPAPAPAHALFEAVAHSRKHVDTFVATEAGSVLQAAGLGGTQRPFVAKLEPGEAPELLDAAALRAMAEPALEVWVSNNRLPVFAQLDRDNFWEATQNAARPLAVLLLDPCEGQEGCTKILQSDAGTSGAGAELRAASRDAALRNRFYFGLLDGRKWVEFAQEHNVEIGEMPRLLVLRAGKPRSFYVGAAGGGDYAGFLRRVAAGDATPEYEGNWGMPERWFRVAVRAVPPLAALNALPRYSLAGPLVLLAALVVGYLLLWLIMFEPPPAAGGKGGKDE